MILTALATAALAASQGAGTINLPPGPYCATTQAAGVYNGVTAGTCPVIPPTQGCPATVAGLRLVTRATVCTGALCLIPHSADLTTWEGLFGAPWPGVGGAAPVIKGFPRDGYICAKFATPAAATYTGTMYNPSYLRDLSPTLTVAISRTGGDWSTGLTTPGCLRSNVYASDAQLMLWKGTTNAPASWCNLPPGGTYYLNIRYGNPGCGSVACALGIVSYHN